MRRREFLGVLGGAAAVWPLPAARNSRRCRWSGFSAVRRSPNSRHLVTAFRQGLNEAGFVEGQNVAIEFRAAEGQNDRLPALVADLIRRPVAVIVGDTISTLAAKAATSTVPIVFATGGDPVKQGMATSMNRPGGNVTGVSFFGGVLGAKRLELLRQLVPKAKQLPCS